MRVRFGFKAGLVAGAFLLNGLASPALPTSPQPNSKVMQVSEIGHFVVGGATQSLRNLPARPRIQATGLKAESVDPNGDFTPGGVYVHFVKLAAPRDKIPILLLPGGGLSGAVYETTPDGRPGWESYFLRSGRSVFTADLQQTGRSPWARFPELNPQEPLFRDRAFLWEVFRLGPPGSYADGLRPFAGSRFPIAAFDTFAKLAAPRFKSPPTAEAETLDRIVQQVCPCILIAHSAAGGPALAAAERRPDLIRAVVAVEPSSVPEQSPHRVPPTLLVWGDFLAPDQTQSSWGDQFAASRRFAASSAPKSTTMLDLPAMGIRGNSHMLMSDLNSDEIAGLIDQWIKSQGF